MGPTEPEMEALRFGGIRHNIDKITIPEYILNKQDPLSTEEAEVMKSNPVAGYNICLPLKKNLGPALEVIRQNQEKLDGSGYQDGLRNEDISTVSRIMAVVDFYDALVSDRTYRKGLPLESAVEALRQEANSKKLDELVVDKLIEIVSENQQMTDDDSKPQSKVDVIRNG